MNSEVVKFAYVNSCEKDELNFTADCIFCTKKTSISGNKTASTNFLKHLKAKHPTEFKQYEASKTWGVKRKRIDVGLSESTVSRPKCEDVFSYFKLPSTVLTQDEFENAVLEFIATDMMPLTTVENQGFRRFCARMTTALCIPSRCSLGRLLDVKFIETFEDMKATLASCFTMSSTADLWSSRNRTFMGVTVHHIDPETLKRKSCIVACRRFHFEHTAERIAEMLAEIYMQFGIREKVKDIVTENAENFSNVFFLFSRQDPGPQCDENDDIEVINIGSIIKDSPLRISIPCHKCCGDHPLNLVIAVDALSARNDRTYQLTYDKAMQKIYALSNALKQSTKAAHYAAEIANVSFIGSESTRWLSEFNTVQCVVEVGTFIVNQVQEKLGLVKITDVEMSFLTQYVTVMRPFAKAVALLQGNDCYQGHLIPTVLGLEAKLKLCNIPMMKPLVCSLQEGLRKRFNEIVNNDEYELSSILIPRFKLRFISSDKHIASRQKLVTAIFKHGKLEDCNHSKHLSPLLQEHKESAVDDDLYSFMLTNQPSYSMQTMSTVLEEVDRYLSDNNEALQSLHQYPRIKHAFMYYNCTPPSSASVERLITTTGQILTPRRCSCNDVTFEMLLLLRNKYIINAKDQFYVHA